MLKHRVRFAVMALCLIALLTVPVPAQTQVQTQIQRSFQFSSASASFFQSTFTSFASANVSVQQGTTQFGNGTFLTVFLTFFSFVPPFDFAFLNGCFQIPDSNFSSGLSGSALNTTIVLFGPNSTPGCPFPIFGGVSPNQAPSQQVTSSFQFNLTWVPTGTLATTAIQTSIECGPFSRQAQDQTNLIRASATGTITKFSGTVTSQGFFSDMLSTKDLQTQEQNIPPSGCIIPFPF